MAGSNVFPTNSSVLSLNLTTPMSGQIIDIQGNFTIDANFEFNGCTVYMEPGAQIIVLPEIIFNVINSEISGCARMWDRIFLVGGGATINVDANSVIKDADIGIFANQHTVFNVKNSQIVNCVKGIFVPPNPQNAYYTNILGTVTGSTFGAVGPFLPDFSTQPPHGIYPKAGIELNNITGMAIGNNSLNQNTFNRLNNGIIGLNSNLRITNSVFTLISPYAFSANYSQNYDGSAIVSVGILGNSNANINVRPVFSSGTTITNSLRGIYTDFSDATITNLIMNLVDNGLFSQNCSDNKRTSISFCTINARLSGIDWFNNTGTGQMMANHNIFNISGNKFGIGIRMREWFNTLPVRYFANCNTINLVEAQNGILATNVFNPMITQNIITQNTNGVNFPSTYGINIDGCFRATASDNTISTNYPFTNPIQTFGINMITSTNSNIRCNTVTNHSYGVNVDGVNGGTNFADNNMNDCWVGLRLNSNAEMGQQINRGNQWNGNFNSTFGAINDNSSGPGLFASLFWVHTPPTTSFYPDIPSNNQNWFFFDAGGSPYSCPSPVLCYDSHIIGGGDSKAYERAIAEDSIETIDYIPESRNLAQQYLYSHLHENDSLLLSDSLYVNFYNYHENNVIGKLYNTSEKIAQRSTYSSVYTQLITLSDSLVKLKEDSIIVIDSLTYATPNINNSVIRQSLVDGINILQQTIINLQLQQRDDAQAFLDTSSIINSTIVPTELPEINSKFINGVYQIYSIGGKDSLIAHLPEISLLANQCPSAGGPSVFTARTLLSLFNDSIEYDDDIVCLQQGIYRIFNEEQSTELDNKDFILIPNPANNVVEIRIRREFAGICKIFVFDAINSLKLEKHIDCSAKSHFMNISNLSPGSYFVKLITNQGQTIKKMIIIR